MKSKQTYRRKVRNGALYKSIDKLLYGELSKLKKQIQEYLDSTILGLEVVWYKSNPYQRENITNWGLELEFENYQWSSKIGKPHWLCINIITLIEVSNKNEYSNNPYRTTKDEVKEDNTLILLETGLRSSFNFDSERKDVIETHIKLDELENDAIQKQQLQELNNRLRLVYAQFVTEIDLINIEELEKYDDEEILLMDEEVNADEEQAICAILDAKKKGIEPDVKNLYRIAYFYDEIVKDYPKAIYYYQEYLKFTFDEKSKQRIKELEEL